MSLEVIEMKEWEINRVLIGRAFSDQKSKETAVLLK